MNNLSQKIFGIRDPIATAVLEGGSNKFLKVVKHARDGGVCSRAFLQSLSKLLDQQM